MLIANITNFCLIYRCTVSNISYSHCCQAPQATTFSDRYKINLFVWYRYEVQREENCWYSKNMLRNVFEQQLN